MYFKKLPKIKSKTKYEKKKKKRIFYLFIIFEFSAHLSGLLTFIININMWRSSHRREIMHINTYNHDL